MFGAALEFSRAVAAATGTAIAKFDLLLTHPRKAPRKGAIGHPLELLGRQYGMLSQAFLESVGFDYWGLPRAPEATPLTVIGWFHWMIPSKIYRALLSAQRTGTDPAFADDANSCAKLVLVAIDRSRTALDEMGKADADARIDGLRDYLAVLSSAVEARFPDARAFIRPGLIRRRRRGSRSGLPTQCIRQRNRKRGMPLGF